MSWFSGFEQICKRDVPLRDHTWYRLGGPARWFFTPQDEEELAALLARCRELGIAWRILGQGANVIARDEGFAGAVIKLEGPAFEEVRFDGELVYAAAGADFPQLIKTCLERGLVGLEGLAGVPGSVGGLVRMNAGGKYGQIADVVDAVRLIDARGRIETRAAAQIGFGYRRTGLAGCTILGARFALRRGDGEAALKKYHEVWTLKQQSQPPVGQRTAGCIFKNPPGKPAGALLEQAGLKGQRYGGAEISTKHANFILAGADATAADVLHLIDHARERVRATADVELELEVDVW